MLNSMMGTLYYFARRYDEAIEQVRRTLAMEPYFAVAHHMLGQVYEEKGMLKEAIEELEKAMMLSGGNRLEKAALGHAYALSGRRAEAQRLLDELREESKQKYVPAYLIAEIYIGMGDKERAFEWLEKAYEERAGYLTFIKVNPRLDSLRSDPRFQDLMRRIGLPAIKSAEINGRDGQI